MPDEPKSSDPPKSSDKAATVITILTVAAGVAKLYFDKSYALAERAVVAMEKNAAATERLASTVTSDRLPGGGESAPYIRVEGSVRDRV